MDDVKSKEQRINYIETHLKNHLPDPKAKTDKVTPASPSYDNQQKSKRGAKRRKSQPKPRTKLIPRNCMLEIPQTRINNIYLELKNYLEVNKHTNAVAVLLRVFIETSLDYLISKDSIIVPAKNNREPKLKQKLQAVETHLVSTGQATTNDMKSIRVAISNDDNIASIDTFHAYVQNPNFNPVPTQLLNSWDNFELLFKTIWK